MTRDLLLCLGRVCRGFLPCWARGLACVATGLLQIAAAVAAVPAVDAPLPTTPSTALAPPPLQLHGSITSLPLTGQLAMLRDPTGRLQIDTLQRAGPQAWRVLPRDVALGFTGDAVWLRAVVVRPDADQPPTWWLALSNPLLREASAFMVEGDDRRAPPDMVGGQARPLSQSGRDRKPVFVVRLPQAGAYTLYLRLQSDAAMAVSAELWQPGALAAANSRETFLWGAMYGAYGLIIVFYLAFWVWTRQTLHLSYVLYMVCNVLAALFTSGWPRHFVPTLDAGTAQVMLGILLALPMFVGVWFSVQLLGVHRHWPRLSRGVLVACGATVAVCALLFVGGHYRTVAPVVQTLSLALIGGLFIVATLLALRGVRSAWLFLGAFSFFYAGVAARYLRNIGHLDPSVWTENGYQIGAFVHMLVMSVGIFSSYGRLRRRAEAADARAAAEAGLRGQQRDFMAMVSHEFRTPLSIIGAAGHNLLNDPLLPPQAGERVRKVLRANARMSDLMETYLANERLLLDDQRPALVRCELLDLCRRACTELKDLDGVDVQLQGAPGLAVRADADMLRIALANLLTNARRHSPPGAALQVLVGTDAGQALVRVRDQGPGIAPQDAPHVFERLYRGRNQAGTPGTGLGLYLVQAIALRHGGTVTWRNLRPTGCEFALRVPLAASPPGHPPPPPAPGRVPGRVPAELTP